MNDMLRTGFAERLKTSAEARKALLAKFQPKPAVTDPQFTEREAQRQAEIQRVRDERAAAKAAKAQAILDAAEANRLSDEQLAEAALDAKRTERKERKALVKAEARAKREARKAGR